MYFEHTLQDLKSEKFLNLLHKIQGFKTKKMLKKILLGLLGGYFGDADPRFGDIDPPKQVKLQRT
jgi:hypothetical protein